MNQKKDGLTRRKFLGGVSATLIGTTALAGCDKENGQTAPPAKPPVEEGGDTRQLTGGTAPASSSPTSEPTAATDDQPATLPAGGKSRVVLVRDPKVIDDALEVDAAVISRMLDDAVVALLGAADAKLAWAQLVRPDDVVGIKTNVWQMLRTPLALEKHMQRRIEEVGVPAANIATSDRGVLRDQVFKRATALFNARPLRTHHWSGVGTCIKNMIMFSPEPSAWHDNSCADLAGVWELPAVKGKVRLNLLVMLTPLFHGKGPHHFNAAYTWPYKGLIVGVDPVAVDATGLRILEAKRREHFGKEMPFTTPVTHLEVAEKKYRLGFANPDKIELVKLGWDEQILI